MRTPPPVVWHTAAPLWRDALRDADASRQRFQRPEILRFATDTFMDDLQAVLADDPDRVGEFVARPETWRDPAVGWTEFPDFDQTQPVKLYQPAHGRFYLVSAALVCQTRGLPDRTVEGAADEAASFVIRRLLPLASGGTPVEHGWFGPDTGWKPINGPDGLDWRPDVGGDGQAAVVREERLPLFPLRYDLGSTGRRRRLFAGLIPVANRERYETAPRTAADLGLDDLDPAPDKEPLADVRRSQFDAWLEGLTLLKEANPKKEARSQDGADWDAEAHNVLAFALLDLLDALRLHLPDLANAIEAENPSGLTGRAEDAYDALAVPIDPGDVTWIEALHVVADHEGALRLGDVPDLNPPGNVLTAAEIASGIAALEASSFAADIRALFAASDPPPLDSLGDLFPGAPPVTDGGSGEGGLYRIRCVYERPRCQPFRAPVVGAPSQPFRLAGFFDPDAPARPTRIALPIDTSPAGLRRFPKNVSFLLSNELRRQMESVPTSLGDLDDGNVRSGPALSLGMICSLSIPIITICALILLMIIVQLLNIVFWWLPLFKICLPIPVSKD